MTVQQLFIPSKIRIGYQNRSDTFTGKLAYVIYYDEKGKIRKEKSWDSWRDNNIEPIEFDNTPFSGYILNKGVQRDGHWGSGRSVIRVHDPRDFEFEVSVDNLIGILMHSDVSKRDIVEECIFAWAGPDLILLPTNSVDYQASVEYTNKQDLKVSTKDLVPGRNYYRKKSDEIVTYIGKFDWWKFDSHDYNKTHVNKGKKHIFKSATYPSAEFTPYSMAILSSAVSDDIVDNYAELVDEFFGTINSQPIKDIVVVPIATEIIDEGYGARYPDMYIINKNQIEQVSYSYYSYHDRHNFSGAKFTKNTKIISYNDSIIVNTEKYPEIGYYRGRSSYSTSIDITKEIHSMIHPIFQKTMDGDYNTLKPSQYHKIMTELGYGEINYVLKNDRQLIYKTYY